MDAKQIIFVIHTKRKEMKINSKKNCALSLLKEGQYKLALEQLYKLFPKVLHFIQKNGGNAQDAKLVFHEALILFFRKAQEIEFKINEQLYDHIIEIVNQLWKNRLSKPSNSDKIQKEKQPAEKVTTDLNQERQKLKAILDFLGDPYHSILIAIYYEQKTMKQIAEQFNFSGVEKVIQYKNKCLDRIRKMKQRFSDVSGEGSNKD